ncbi:hypothetical protein CYMTET_45842 [Cymbomonas tetramitiformis]|uniref:3-oxo-5-alpha-steroid 4-dehydrogenase C-terminal domain-containing protein n=1 Tax=Cymbomonas tetramitiformis TaxID=36881 RepID=A0AAE0BYS8_9CHLO|nr:hypothetical protein CYMTET_45842 [Cymbomonas tetramitiformis]
MIIHQNTGTTSKDKGRTIFDLHSSPRFFYSLPFLTKLPDCIKRQRLSFFSTPTPITYWCAISILSWSCWLGTLPRAFQKAVAVCVVRGKLTSNQTVSKERGTILERALVPHRWFCHFYLAGIFWTSALILRQLRISRLAAYSGGQTYYLLAALSLGLSQLPFRDTSTNAPWLTISRLLGVLTFAQGSLHQHRCHRILATLRSSRPALTDKTPARKPSTTDEGQVYKIPCGDWFDFLSCAHYTAEVVIYIGLLIVAGAASLSVWMMIFSVVGNLGLAAGLTHRWYLSHISSYPKNRKAFIPYVY